MDNIFLFFLLLLIFEMGHKFSFSVQKKKYSLPKYIKVEQHFLINSDARKLIILHIQIPKKQKKSQTT